MEQFTRINSEMISDHRTKCNDGTFKYPLINGGARFAGTYKADDEVGREYAVFYSLSNEYCGESFDDMRGVERTTIIDMESISKLSRKLKIYDVKKNGIVRLIEESKNNDLVNRIVISYIIHSNKHVVAASKHLYSFNKDEMCDDTYLMLSDIVKDYPCIEHSAIEDGKLFIDVCE
jgi:hypothetical protein